jgi:hypothetical protein
MTPRRSPVVVAAVIVAVLAANLAVLSILRAHQFANDAGHLRTELANSRSRVERAEDDLAESSAKADSLQLETDQLQLETDQLRADLAKSKREADEKITTLNSELAQSAAQLDALQAVPPTPIESISLNGPWTFSHGDPTCEGWIDNAAACANLARVLSIRDGTLSMGEGFGTVALTSFSVLEFGGSTKRPGYSNCQTAEEAGDLTLVLRVTELVNRPNGKIVARKIVGSFTITTPGVACRATKNVGNFEGTLVGT